MDRTEPASSSRREREKERHRREILEAAERVFTRKGYHLATVEEVAREAEFAVGSIYMFFRGKEELYSCVILEIARDFMASFESEVLTRNDPMEAIAALIELRLKNFENHRGFFRAFLEVSPGARFDPARALPAELTEFHQQYIRAVSGVFERGVRKGQFDKVDPLYLTLTLEGILNAFVAYWSWHEPQEPLAVRVKKLSNLFLDRIRPASRRRKTGGAERNARGVR